MRVSLLLLWGLLLAQTALADGLPLYAQVLARVEQMLPPEPVDAAERGRLLGALASLAAAYAERYPAAPPPRLRLVGGGLISGVARSLDHGLILVDPQQSARLSEPALAGMLAHELAHIALGHGWARVGLAYAQVEGERPYRLAMAMTGRHALRGSPAWSALLYSQEHAADREGRQLLAQAGLPPGWLGEAIQLAAEPVASESHPGLGARLAALASY